MLKRLEGTMEIDQPVRCQIRHMLNPDKLGAFEGWGGTT